ncbi:hypothetical protein DXG01_015643 [Tephrocybe rancida]|nr:hypothetical protein DXG01_015643 [Tephrocybe rancida]
MVKRDLDLYCRVAAVDAFINHYFKVSTTVVDEVLEKMEELGHYDPTGERWQWNDAGVFKDMPSSSAKESVFYSPLANICEAIRKAHITKHFDSRWIVSADNPPKSPDQNASLIRPDIVLLLGMESEGAEWEKALKELANDETKLIKVITAWWLKIGAIIEVKRKEDKDQMEHITQLMSYLRQLLREQSDRWFVPGLMFSGNHLAVWVADRSGALGTERSFDIHGHPKLFIQVVLGCSSLEPQQLGYDTTMRLWKSPSEYLPSYTDNINIKINDSAKSAYERKWVIKMSSPADDGKRELFVTIKALSVARAECMEGRATVVWVARKILGSGKFSDEIYVLKQAWRPAEGKHEGEMYPAHQQAKDYYIGRVYSFEDVNVAPGIKVETKNFIRGNLEYREPPAAHELNVNQKRAADNLDDAERKEPLITLISTSDQFVFNFKTDTVIVDRVLARTLLVNSFGWPLHQFYDLRELIRVTLHAAKGQLLFLPGPAAICLDFGVALEYLAYEQRTLQRDISPGNVLIHFPGGTSPTEGCVIDFDSAKMTEEMRPTILRRGGINRQFPDDTLCALARHPDNIDTQVYLRRMTTAPLFPNNKNKVDENVERYTGSIPDFTTRTPKQGARSATLPFASSEVLTSTRIFSTKGERAGHSLVHDLEALFWCLIYICITCDGPGGKRRKELKPDYKVPKDDEELNIALCHINYCLFATNDIQILAHNKSTLFACNDFVEHVIPHFHPYFEPLKSLMTHWWNILHVAHQFPTLFETPHLAIKMELAKTYGELQLFTPSAKDLQKSADVTELRNKQLAEVRAWPSDVQPAISYVDLSPRSRSHPISSTTRPIYKQADPPPSPIPAPNEARASKKARVKADSPANTARRLSQPSTSNMKKNAGGNCEPNLFVQHLV